MLFSSTVFLFFFLPIVLFGYYVLFKKSRMLQNIFLLTSSLVFYAWGEPKFVLIMILSVVMNWLFGLLVDRFRDKKKKAYAVIAAAAVFNIGLLFIFKYLVFTLKNINALFSADIAVPDIALPIGISFFTFQAFSYVIDVYRGDGEMQKNPLNVGLYISFFPQLIAGPIVRYRTVADEIKNRKETLSDFTYGVTRFMTGFIKKAILANTMAVVADAAFDSTETLSVSFAWLGAIAYSFQIYYDFSGYSDMGIGLGRMFGFHFLENFDYPYKSCSITEFWRRWHISLGTWFRDYVYFTLGGSRVESKLRLVFNLFVVWMLTGIWHGANWTFILWGFMYFVLLTAEKLTGFAKKEKTIKPLRYIYTMLFVVLGWVLFRAKDLSSAFIYLKSMFALSGNDFLSENSVVYLKNYAVILIICAVFSLPFAKYVSKKYSALGERAKTVSGVIYQIALFAAFLIAVSYIVKGTYNPFIYFNF